MSKTIEKNKKIQVSKMTMVCKNLYIKWHIIYAYGERDPTCSYEKI